MKTLICLLLCLLALTVEARAAEVPTTGTPSSRDRTARSG